MGSITAYIGLGSNLDDPIAQVKRALEELERLPDSHCIAQSSLYRSKPMGPQDQPNYINAVAALETGLGPLDLLEALQALEHRHGRVRVEKRWGPRTLDLDLLLYGDQVIDIPRLQVPHPGLRQRSFVLIPLHEIAPELILPDGTRLDELAGQCDRGGLKQL